MPQIGDPFVGNIPKKLNQAELLQALRFDIAAELEAIMGYEAHLQATDDERVKRYSPISLTRGVMWGTAAVDDADRPGGLR